MTRQPTRAQRIETIVEQMEQPAVVKASLYQKELGRRLDAELALARLADAMYKIAYDPFGPSDASAAQVLNDITELARAEYEKASAVLAQGRQP